MDSAKDLVIDYGKQNHPIKVNKVAKTLIVKSNGEEVVRTKDAYLLDESGHKPVYYFPMRDVKSGILRPTATKTTCPYKGVANYYTLVVGGKEYKDGVWQYASSTEDFVPIRDYVAFYDHAVEKIEEE